MPLIDITDANFDAETDKYPIVIFDFWAPWCGPCKSFAPIFEAAAAAHPEILFAKVNTDDEKELAKQFQIMSIPTLVAAKDGEIVKAQVGVMHPPQLDALIKQLKN